MTHIVYGLEDPRDHLYHYIGVTDNVYARFIQHVTGSGGNIEKNGWIFECRQVNIMILMREIERAQTFEEAKQREGFWISYYLHLGHPLHNILVAKSILEEKARLESQHQQLLEEKAALEELVHLRLAEKSRLAAMRKYQRTMPEGEQKVLELFLQGLPLRAIAKATGLTFYQVQKITSDKRDWSSIMLNQSPLPVVEYQPSCPSF